MWPKNRQKRNNPQVRQAARPNGLAGRPRPGGRDAVSCDRRPRGRVEVRSAVLGDAAQPGQPRSPVSVGASGRVSLHMDNLDIRQALELLSRQATLNILVAPGVQGQITVNLDGVTVEQAFDALLKLGNLSATRE